MVRGRRGVSEIISSLLLILIVCSLGTALYSYTLQVNQSQQDSLLRSASTQTQQAQERFRATATWWSGSGNQIRVTVLNYGVNSLQISDAYVDGQRVATWSSGRLTDVYVGSLQDCTFTSPVTITSGNPYTLILVSSRGVSIVHAWKP